MIRVLIADDHAVVRQGLRTYLDLQEDIEVVAEACDGEIAVDAARRTDPDVILLDLVMPNVDGWQFIEERSHDPRLAQIPVVLISGQVAARETARSLGLASYIEKPIGVASLREMLARMRESTASPRT